VVCAGKPFPPIYKDALALAQKAAGRPIDRARVLVIGDAMRTDIAGAVDQGLDSLFVSSGIHRHELPTLRDHHSLYARAGLWPTAAIHDLVW
jgi:ribonucleotide monophosphatase NagD (HAD superfamily)